MSINNNDNNHNNDRGPPGSGGFGVSPSGGNGSPNDGPQAGYSSPSSRSTRPLSSISLDLSATSPIVPLASPTGLLDLPLVSPATIIISSPNIAAITAPMESASTESTADGETSYTTPTNPPNYTPFQYEQPSHTLVKVSYSSTTTPVLAFASATAPTSFSTVPKAVSSSSPVGLAVGTGTSASAGSNPNQNPSLLPDTHPSGASLHSMSTAQVVAAVLLPLVVVSSLAALVFLCLRRRRRQKATPVGSEKKIGLERDHTATQHAVPPQSAPRIIHPPAPQPVILSPNMNSAYFTGIDTSDAVSMPDGRVSTSGYSYDPEHGEEPPPPYRPRSLAPAVSRDSSVRQPATAGLSQVALMDPRMPQEQTDRNPFEDDAVSEISEHGDEQSERGVEDRFSEVSDLSYQDEPTTTHHTI